MTETIAETVEVPGFLRDNVLAIERRYRAGQWTMDISGETWHSTDWVKPLLSQTLECFPWASVSGLEIVYSDGRRVACDAPESHALPRLESAGRGDVGCNGLAATLDLCLYWIDAERRLGSSRIPHAGYLVMDRLNTDTASIDLTIYPNLFTDTIHRLQKRERRFDAVPIPFAPAAAKNRKRLHDSLVSWESRLHGTITSWDSDLIDVVHRHGFSDESAPFE
ncbi:MAG: hypothetical protein FJ271_08715 [Planctomycetes bacterium]|nr:hypothetical protein [Planctomycetota bacterium]